ncbi:unnamed protein product [Dovyalis caffra]|uniref:Uncharacterized protein n=1 Tax=Dovyalis caffra TaxID=77055 RepID=A0AAV1QXP2_9ROSI|nr:unnamed protein product [Dovyalis caffra]
MDPKEVIAARYLNICHVYDSSRTTMCEGSYWYLTIKICYSLIGDLKDGVRVLGPKATSVRVAVNLDMMTVQVQPWKGSRGIRHE